MNREVLNDVNSLTAIIYDRLPTTSMKERDKLKGKKEKEVNVSLYHDGWMINLFVFVQYILVEVYCPKTIVFFQKKIA